MAAARQGLPVRLDRAPQRGAAFAITRASRRARTRSVGSRSPTMGSLLIFDHPPAVAPPPSPGPSSPCRPRPRLARVDGLGLASRLPPVEILWRVRQKAEKTRSEH